MAKNWTKEEKQAYQKEYFPKHYQANKAYYIEKAHKRTRELRVWLEEYKKNLKCIKCGEDHPACLKFHHTNPADKEMAVSECVGKGWGKERILREIDKCEVLCGNCHDKFHWEEKKHNEQ